MLKTKQKEQKKASVCRHFDVFAQCHRYELNLWQCPQFLFIIMGFIIVGSSLIAYGIGTRYFDDPGIIVFIVSVLTIVLFIIAFVIIRSFERLAETNRMKTEFVDIVSHQLRAPVTNLRWTIDFLTSTKLEEKKKKEYLGILKENSDRMEELISDLLIVSRLAQGKNPLRKQETDIITLIQETAIRLQPFAQASNVEIKFNFPDDLSKIFIDPSQTKLVVENLIENAVHYTKGGGAVQIKLEERENCIYCTVEDEGMGIPEEDQKYIFQKFFRSKNVVKHQTQGSGLGLFIAKSIIKRSGGDIGFVSKENKGSTFWFTLPISMK